MERNGDIIDVIDVITLTETLSGRKMNDPRSLGDEIRQLPEEKYIALLVYLRLRGWPEQDLSILQWARESEEPYLRIEDGGRNA